MESYINSIKEFIPNDIYSSTGKVVDNIKFGEAIPVHNFKNGSLEKNNIYYVPISSNKEIISFLSIGISDDGNTYVDESKLKESYKLLNKDELSDGNISYTDDNSMLN
jgi:hypothetical protein